VSISSTLNVRIFRTNVIFLVTFWLCQKICTKNSRVWRWWNWRQDTRHDPNSYAKIMHRFSSDPSPPRPPYSISFKYPRTHSLTHIYLCCECQQWKCMLWKKIHDFEKVNFGKWKPFGEGGDLNLNRCKGDHVARLPGTKIKLAKFGHKQFQKGQILKKGQILFKKLLK